MPKNEYVQNIGMIIAVIATLSSAFIEVNQIRVIASMLFAISLIVWGK